VQRTGHEVIRLEHEQRYNGVTAFFKSVYFGTCLCTDQWSTGVPTGWCYGTYRRGGGSSETTSMQFIHSTQENHWADLNEAQRQALVLYCFMIGH
jgi:hypothetical protein